MAKLVAPTRAAPMGTQSFDGFPDGMNIARPAQEIADTQARYLQDVFVHQRGVTDRRGPLTSVSGMVTFTTKIVGGVQVTDPQGTTRVAVLHTDGTTLKLGILSSNYTSKTDITIGTTVPYNPAPIVDAKPALSGGSWIGISANEGINPSYSFLIHWRGANLPNYTTGTATVTYGSKNVTGAGTTWSTNITPGMFLFDGSGQYVGVVQSVTSDTALVLEEAPLTAIAGAAYTAQSLRGYWPKVVTGFATTGTGTVNVTGGNTFFRDQGVAAGWKMFRTSDGTFIGTVATVTNNVGLTLGANATVAMSEEDYILVSNTADYGFSLLDTTKARPGFLNAVYAGHQWFANRGVPADAGGEWINRIWFSDVSDPEAMNFSIVSGDFIPITSGQGVNTPVKAIVPAYNSMLILKERETFALLGTNPNDFEPRKLLDDGALSGMSAVAYNGGVIWAGKDGIYYYDGLTATNITIDTLGDAYKAMIASFNPTTTRMWGTVIRDHYFLHIQTVTPSVPVIKGPVSASPTEVTIVIYMPRHAVTMFTNLNFRGAAILPSTSGQTAWMFVNDSTKGYVISADAIFDTDGVDPFACDGGTIGPDMYIESKKYSLGDGLRKKLWKQLMMWYLVGGDYLKLDTITGLNTVGSTTVSTWPITTYTWDSLVLSYPTWDALAAAFPTWDSITQSVFFVKRIKFIKRSQYIAFRIYQHSNSVTQAKIAGFALGFKLQRPGRI